MEASESPQISFKRAESRGVLRLVGNGPAVQELIANDDHRTGFARLELMVSTVLERLTAPDDPVGRGAGS